MERDKGETMKNIKDFYEEYWRYRKKIGHLAQKEIPERLKIVCSMIKPDKFPINVLDVGCGGRGTWNAAKRKTW